MMNGAFLFLNMFKLQKVQKCLRELPAVMQVQVINQSLISDAGKIKI